MNLNSEDLKNLQKKLERFTRTTALRVAAKVIQKQIKNQTEVGRDVNGSLFKPYTKRYAKKRQSWGLRTDRVNLQVKGEMLNSMFFDSVNNEVRLSGEQEPKALGLTLGNRNIKAKRKFMGVSSLDKPMIEEAIAKALSERE